MAGEFAPHVQVADIEGRSWSEVATPEGMTNGQRSAAVTFDGSRYVVIGGHWLAGIWRYVEP